MQPDAFQGHWHGDGTSSGINGARSSAQQGFINVDGTLWENKSNVTNKNSISDGTNGTPRVSNETRSINASCKIWKRIA